MNKFRSFIKTVSKPILNTWIRHYYRKPRNYTYMGIKVVVDPSVFPPQLTISTKILLDFISELDLEKKTFLELGCGSGIISLYANKKGAIVTASDINEIALENLNEASIENNLEIQTIHSDLFEELSGKAFDYIIINPPYYAKDPIDIKEKAWYCGKDFEYFKRLFSQLSGYLSEDNRTYIILSEDCDIQRITQIADQNNIALEIILRIKKFGETSYIYRTNR